MKALVGFLHEGISSNIACVSDLDGEPGHGEHDRHRDDHLRHLPPVLVGLAAGRAHWPLKPRQIFEGVMPEYVVFSIFHGIHLLHEPVDHDGVHGHYEQQRQEVAEDEEAQLKTNKNI